MLGSPLLPWLTAFAIVWRPVDAAPSGGAVAVVNRSSTSQLPGQRRRLPEGPLIVAYATSCGDGGDTVLEEARAGVNVVVWFAAKLVRSAQGVAEFSFALGSRRIHCIVAVARQLVAEGLPTTHLVSIGGWNGPHPTPGPSGADYFTAFESFQAWVSSQQSQESGSSTDGAWSFDGIDWDLEGNDDSASRYNEFSLETLAVMGEFSQSAKAAGYLVTLAPAQSYFDVSTSQFSRSVRWPPSQPWHPEFLYAGRNVYSYVFAAYGKTVLNTLGLSGATTVTVDTFDFVAVQLYETCSNAAYFTEAAGMRSSEYIAAWVMHFLLGAGASPSQAPPAAGGWLVNFGSDPSLPDHFTSRRIELHVPTQLVVGLIAPGYGSVGKTFSAPPEAIEEAWVLLHERSKIVPRGVMFWNIGLDVSPKNGTCCHMARGLNRFLKTRQSAPRLI